MKFKVVRTPGRLAKAHPDENGGWPRVTQHPTLRAHEIVEARPSLSALVPPPESITDTSWMSVDL